MDDIRKRWHALAPCSDHDDHPIGDSAIENATVSSPWGARTACFASSPTVSEAVANSMRLIVRAEANRRDPHAHLKDVLTHLSAMLDRDIATLLPHPWQPAV